MQSVARLAEEYSPLVEHLPTEERPAQPDELAALGLMRDRLYAVLHNQISLTDGQLQIVQLHEGGERQHRVIITQAGALRHAIAPTFVGFFGQRRPGACPELLAQIDSELIGEFTSQPHVLSYSSLELADRSWANLVLLSDPAGLRRWADGARHAYAARSIAPASYRAIRLLIGRLAGGLAPDAPLHVSRIRHIGYGFAS
jgi:hypothetical protein